MKETQCCGQCWHHKYTVLGEFVCDNEESEAYGLSTLYDDICENFEERGEG